MTNKKKIIINITLLKVVAFLIIQSFFDSGINS